MKINFIRNLSDDVLKENHQLKSNIVLLKQQATSMHFIMKFLPIRC